MIIKVLSPVSGNGFAFGPNQVVANVDPEVGEDLVKHGLAVEIDEDGKMIPGKADELPVKGGNSPEETNKSEADKAETANVDLDGEASDDKSSDGETPEDKQQPKTETATVKNAPVKK